MNRLALNKRLKKAEAKVRTNKTPRVIRGGLPEFYQSLAAQDIFTRLFGEEGNRG